MSDIETSYSDAQVLGSVNRAKTRSHAYGWFVCAIAAIFYCYAYFLRVSPSDMMTDLVSHFHMDAAMFGNLSAFYYYAYTPMQLPVGVIIDRMGARLVLASACLFSVFGLFVFIVADNYYMASVGRFLVGFGSAFAYISVLKLATIWLPPNRFATVAGATTAFGMAAAIWSDMYLGHVVHSMGYRAALNSCLIAGVILSVIILLFVRNRPKNTNVQTTNEPKASFKSVLAGMYQMAKNPQMWLIGVLGALLYLPASMFLDLWGIPYLESVYHLTPVAASSLVAMVFVGWIISAPLLGALSDKIGLRRLPLTICSLGAAVIVSIIFYFPHLSVDSLYVLFLLFGMFCGVHPLVFSLSRENNPNQLSGTATAITNCLIMMGGVIFQPLVGWLLDLHWSGTLINGLPHYSAHDFTFAMTVLPICLVASTILTLIVRETYCQIPAEDS